MTKKITVKVSIGEPIEKIWKLYTEPEHIVKWNSANDNWHTTKAENDLRAGGKFNSRMEAKDGSAGFDFEGTYDKVVENKLILYTMSDERKVKITFVNKGGKTELSVAFEAEETNPVEMQKNGWQAILNNFKKYAEGEK